MQTSIPPTQNDLGPVVRRQVVARPRMQRRSRPLRWSRLAFLIFILFFMLIVFLIISG